jgi:retinol dehydrogenase-12
MFYPPRMGAHTELYAALSPDITMENNGTYIYPWGRIGALKQLKVAVQPSDESIPGTGRAEKFWEWSEKAVGNFC